MLLPVFLEPRPFEARNAFRVLHMSTTPVKGSMQTIPAVKFMDFIVAAVVMALLPTNEPTSSHKEGSLMMPRTTRTRSGVRWLSG